MTTMGCDRGCSWGEGLGVSVKDRLTGWVSFPVEVAIDRVRIGMNCLGN